MYGAFHRPVSLSLVTSPRAAAPNRVLVLICCVRPKGKVGIIVCAPVRPDCHPGTLPPPFVLFVFLQACFNHELSYIINHPHTSIKPQFSGDPSRREKQFFARKQHIVPALVLRGSSCVALAKHPLGHAADVSFLPSNRIKTNALTLFTVILYNVDISLFPLRSPAVLSEAFLSPLPVVSGCFTFYIWGKNSFIPT